MIFIYGYMPFDNLYLQKWNIISCIVVACLTLTLGLLQLTKRYHSHLWALKSTILSKIRNASAKLTLHLHFYLHAHLYFILFNYIRQKYRLLKSKSWDLANWFVFWTKYGPVFFSIDLVPVLVFLIAFFFQISFLPMFFIGNMCFNIRLKNLWLEPYDKTYKKTLIVFK